MGDSVDLLEQVFARPDAAVAEARALLATAPSDFDASVAHHVIGLAHREYGEIDAAIAQLRRAQALARRSGSEQRQSDVLATLGIALVHAGQTSRGLATLDRAVSAATGVLAARARFRRGGALWILGRHREALDDVGSAVPVLRQAGDTLWTARALTLRGLINLALGRTQRADVDLKLAEQLFTAIGERHASAHALHNQGLLRFRSGDLPGALRCLDEVEQRYRELGTPTPELAVDRCEVLLTAGLAADAVRQAEDALADAARRRGQATRRAELLLTAARAAVAADDAGLAADRAASAAALFAAQHRPWWHAHARLLTVQARFAMNPAGGRPNVAMKLAAELDGLGSPEATQAYLLAGRLALAAGSPATTPLAAAARARFRGPAVARVDGWLARALLAKADGDRRRMFAACRRGLDLLDEHRLTLGAAELRAQATTRGAELAELAAGACHDPRRLLRWSERWRATVCAVPAVRPPDDPLLGADLAALREVSSRLQRAHQDGLPTHALESERRNLERRTRARTWQSRARSERAGEVDVGDLLDALGAGRLLEIVDLGGDLHVLVCGAGRVRRVRAGRMAEAGSAVQAVRLTLRLLAYGHREPERLWDRLADLGRRLQRVLLGPAVRLLDDGPAVIVPPARLHGVPWALLPALSGRTHGVAPSATAWLRSLRATSRSDRVVLVHGPDLTTQGAEVPALSRIYPAATVLRDGMATAVDVLKTLDGAALAHLAAHGTFRADNPLFSSIQLDDGPMTVYDLERMHRAPHRIVLPVCSSGELLSVGADELLGLTTALLPLGTAGIVATLVPVNDAATVPFMLALHRSLRAGASCAQALHDARASTPDDPVLRAAAVSFVALGAG